MTKPVELTQDEKDWLASAMVGFMYANQTEDASGDALRAYIEISQKLDMENEFRDQRQEAREFDA